MCELFINADSKLWQNTTRSLRINGVVTSLRLENAFWSHLQEIAQRDDLTLPQLLARLYQESLEAGHDLTNFASFLRVCCSRYLALQITGDIPVQPDVSLSSLDSKTILQREHIQSQAMV
ncbi:ribbon-helix-helix domain-containing protein [Polycladidibacter stylochi]|uniref:ribbon-helix-helix domain-containing protein n=1 Tax=Polycladidibacter stylochi TaxID=1807766 RepID=UPI000832B940|nr:ribbon-helix-helix domain-containing protein [Pseudovibrio stylochi]